MLSQVRGEHVCGDEAREMLGRAKIKMYVTCTDSLTANKGSFLLSGVAVCNQGCCINAFVDG